MYLSFSTIFANDFCVLSRSSLFSCVSEGPQTPQDCSKILLQNTIQRWVISSFEAQNCGCYGEVAFLHSLFWSIDCNFHPKIAYFLWLCPKFLLDLHFRHFFLLLEASFTNDFPETETVHNHPHDSNFPYHLHCCSCGGICSFADDSTITVSRNKLRLNLCQAQVQLNLSFKSLVKVK